MKLSFYLLLGIALSAIIAIAMGPDLGFANSSNQVTANVNVGNVVYISISPLTGNFGEVYPTNSYSTTVQFTDNDIGGNLAANIFVSGNVWYLGGNTFGVSNTLWAATTGVSSGNVLTGTASDTHITIAQPNINNPSQSNSIYFGVNIPAAVPAGIWTQNVIFENENLSTGTNSLPTNTIQLTANVQPTCYITLTPSTISFGSISAGANVATNVLVTDTDNGGNAAANVLLEGTNWALTSNTQVTFGVSNTLYDSSSLGTYNGNQLTNTIVTTSITVAAPSYPSSSSANVPIYFGLGIPGGASAGAYTQNIIIENSC